ncbi:hypothetical protein V1477_009202 [Vespula maculifrons]|uniref:Uncharacterized protein n=1 Tax=Vespula maculifrons TaxID=7453 RepID=A0ABD2CC17_VESMC
MDTGLAVLATRDNSRSGRWTGRILPAAGRKLTTSRIERDSVNGSWPVLRCQKSREVKRNSENLNSVRRERKRSVRSGSQPASHPASQPANKPTSQQTSQPAGRDVRRTSKGPGDRAIVELKQHLILLTFHKIYEEKKKFKPIEPPWRSNVFRKVSPIRSVRIFCRKADVRIPR